MKFDEIMPHPFYLGNLYQPQIVTQNHHRTFFKSSILPNEIICAFGTKIPPEVNGRLTGEVLRVRKGRIRFRRDFLCEFGILKKLGIVFGRRMIGGK
jgi:hypothetical protein